MILLLAQAGCGSAAVTTITTPEAAARADPHEVLRVIPPGGSDPRDREFDRARVRPLNGADELPSGDRADEGRVRRVALSYAMPPGARVQKDAKVVVDTEIRALMWLMPGDRVEIMGPAPAKGGAGPSIDPALLTMGIIFGVLGGGAIGAIVYCLAPERPCE